MPAIRRRSPNRSAPPMPTRVKKLKPKAKVAAAAKAAKAAGGAKDPSPPAVTVAIVANDVDYAASLLSAKTAMGEDPGKNCVCGIILYCSVDTII